MVVKRAELRMRPLSTIAARDSLISVALDFALVARVASLPDALPIPSGRREDVVDVRVRQRRRGSRDGARLRVGRLHGVGLVHGGRHGGLRMTVG